MKDITPKPIDVHVHVGLVGDQWPQWGHLSEWYRKQLTYKIFLLYAGIKPGEVSDSFLHQKMINTISASNMNKVVCLALDHVYDRNGVPHPEASNVWVHNDYVIKLRNEVNKVLLGASVHPYAKDFEDRVRKYIAEDAVLLKWVPSAMQFDLAEEKVGQAMKFLATAKDGNPLPLLLHVGPEYALPTTDEKTFTYDFHSWSLAERVRNWFRFNKRWHTPQTDKIRKNIEEALDAGAVIIFAHCGLSYFASGLFAFLEHSDFYIVRRYLEMNDKNRFKGKCYADVSALCTPFRRQYFNQIKNLPEDYLLFGSDFPTPVFEIFADTGEMMNDLKAVLKGHFERIIVPQNNLLDVNYQQLQQAFHGHPMFTNFSKLI